MDEVGDVHALGGAAGLLGDLIGDLALVAGIHLGVYHRQDGAVDGVVLADGPGLALVEAAARVRDGRGVGLRGAFGLRLLQRGNGKGAELVERLPALDVLVNGASVHVRRAGETIHFTDVLGGENRLVLFGCVHYLELLGGSSAFWGDVLATRHTHPGVSGNGNERCFIRRP